MSRPLIGLTLDSEAPGGWSSMPWYAIRENYCDAVAAAGGLAICLPHQPELAESYLDELDGVLVTGGAFDVDPALFGAATRHSTVTLKEKRTAFELAVTRGALARDLPVLGICGGQQLLNVVLGGTLIQHIPDEVDQPLAHEQPNPRTEAGHSVSVAEGTKLRQIVGKAEIAVNSAHHQAVKTLGPGIVANALAPDGVVEGIEDPRQRFCIGVQWHPEYHITGADSALFDAFVSACRR